MSAQSALRTAAEYLLYEASAEVRHEFVSGSVYRVPEASRNHVLITSALSGVLFRETFDGPNRNLNQSAKVWIEATTSYFYPDATISCPPNFIDDKNGVIDNPTVIFEVLSPSTASLDRGPKFAAYRTLSSLREFVVIDSESARIEVFSLEQEQWVVRFFSGLDSVALAPSVQLSISLGEIYRHVVF